MNNPKPDRFPLYVQLREMIRAKIEKGEYLPGTGLPTENQLAEMYGLNRSAVHSALKALEYEGLLQSVQGKGVYVCGPKLTRDMETLGGFRQTMQERDVLPSTKVLRKVLRRAGPLYAILLKVEEEALIWYIERICYSENEPVALEEIYIPQSILPDLGNTDLDLFSIMDLYRWNDIHPIRGEQTLSIVYLDPADSKLIGLEGKQAVLQFSGTMFTEEQRIVEFSRSFTRQDQAEYIVHFRK